MARIAFYISGHGLGHAMRMKELLGRVRALDPRGALLVMGSMPGWVFTEPPALPAAFRRMRCDAGASQRNSLRLDVRRTLVENRAFYRGIGGLAREEAGRLRRARVGLVVGDIPPLAFLAASAAGIPSVAVGNFSWDWIYEAYEPAFPSFRPIVELIRDAYARADLLLRLPFHGRMDAFRRVRDIPLITRRAARPRGEIRRALGIPRGERRKVVFVSMGGHDNAGTVGGGRADFGDYLYVSFFRLSAKMRHLILPESRAGIPHQEIVAASDCVISKPGYCTVAECIANRTPLVYTPRDDFREFGVMEAAVRRHCAWHRIPRRDFHDGAWAGHLDAFFAAARPAPAPMRTDGADVAARIILEMAGGAARPT
jgi:L-arabinokinase